jgi:hypothetical protein
MIPPQAFSNLSDAKILIVGIARNCENDIRHDVLRLYAAFKSAERLYWFIVESDSSDRTPEVLASLESEVPDFRFRSLGNLEASIPHRTHRLSYCRNVCLDELNSNPAYASVDLVVVADLDGVNNLVASEGIESCFTRSDWDVCTANQRGPYYDLWALRHPVWNPNDCLKQYAFLVQRGTQRELAAWVSSYGKMITIPESADWIPVDSAFGGLGIYRRSILAGARYEGVDENGEGICEHVPLNNQLRARGAKIFINPRLINTTYTENSRQRTVKQSLKRGARYILRRLRPTS